MHVPRSHANRSFWIRRQDRFESRAHFARSLSSIDVTLPLTGRSILATLHDMRQTDWLVHRRTIAVVALVVGASFGVFHIRDASSEPSVADGAPSGMVTFVGGGVCPPGWVHASELEGRTIVGTLTSERLGIDVGTPFTDREERVHDHHYTGSVVLDPKEVGVPIGLNGTVAAAGTYPIEGMAEESGGQLPFFQMEACIKP